MIKVTATDSAIKVDSPYAPAFVDRARAAGGKWGGVAWVFPLAAREAVEGILADVYCWQPGAETVDAKVSIMTRRGGFPERLYGLEALRGPVIVAGKVLANARSRDFGATPGDDVIYLEKTPRSGGSAKNWESQVPGGAVLKLLNVTPLGLADLDRHAEAGDLVYEVLERHEANPLAAFSDAELLAEVERRGIGKANG